MKKNFKIFSGTANHHLAQKVAKRLGVELGKSEIVRFADGECRARVEEEIGSGTVFVLQSLCPPVDENLMELCLLANTLKRNGAQKLIAVVPYLGYARQDKVHRKGECLSAEIVAKIIESVGFEKIITFDVHSEKALRFFKIPTENLSANTVLAEAIRPSLQLRVREGKAPSECTVVAPDKGAMNRAREIAKVISAQASFIEKERDLLTGGLKIRWIKGEVAGQKIVICDDMITSGGTLVLAAQYLKAKKAEKIFACAVHPLLVKNAKRDLMESSIAKVFVTDTIPIAKEKMFAKLEITTVAPLIASAIENSV